MKVIKRSFEALQHENGSVERARLNLSWVTSEYLPSIKFGIVENDGTPTCWNYKTKRECESKITDMEERRNAEGRA